MEDLKRFTAHFENTLEAFSQPIKPWLPGIARFLLVVTFLEDSIRIVTQWNNQVYYLEKYRGFPWFTAEMFLAVNVVTMLVCSYLAIAKKYTEIACAGLFGVVITQSLGYGLIFDSSFVFRNLSVIGGLLMLLADAYSSSKRMLFAGLPSMSETNKSTYLQLGGRVLLVFLFLGFILGGEFSILRLIISIISLIGCVMVVVGFKAKWSAWILITFLSISNIFLNPWWSLHDSHPQKDFMKYDFFQTLSIMGGFLLLVNLGPGGISMDEKKKNF